MNTPLNPSNPETALGLHVQIPGLNMDPGAALSIGGLLKYVVHRALDHEKLLLPKPPQAAAMVLELVKTMKLDPDVLFAFKKWYAAEANLNAAYRNQLEVWKATPGLSEDALRQIQEQENRLLKKETNLSAASANLAVMESLFFSLSGFIKSLMENDSAYIIAKGNEFLVIAHVSNMVSALQVVKIELERVNLLPFAEIAHGDSELNNFRTFHPPGATQPFDRHASLIKEPLAKFQEILSQILLPDHGRGIAPPQP